MSKYLVERSVPYAGVDAAMEVRALIDPSITGGAS